MSRIALSLEFLAIYAAILGFEFLVGRRTTSTDMVWFSAAASACVVGYRFRIGRERVK